MSECFDLDRVLAWMRQTPRKPANLSFTEGPERQAAYLIEMATAQQAAEIERLRAIIDHGA